MTNDIHIHLLDEGKMSYKTKYPIAFDDLLSVAMTLCLGAMNDVTENAPEGSKEECKGALYDLFNVAASKVLQNFAPEMELRPNLTAQAIMEAENRIIMEDRLGEVADGS